MACRPEPCRRASARRFRRVGGGDRGGGRRGKSALVADLMAGWVEHGGWVLGGGGVAIPGLQALQSPYGVFVEAVRGVQRLPGVPPALVEEARAWVAPSQRVGELMDPATVRQEALLGLVHRLAGIAPLVIVVEDLHWADPASLSSLVFLTRHVGDAPVGLLVTSRRPGDVATDAAGAGDGRGGAGRLTFSAVLEYLRRTPAAVDVALHPLTDDNIKRMARDRQVTHSGHLRQIIELAEGNPLLAAELAALTFDEGRPLLPHTVDAVVEELSQLHGLPAVALGGGHHRAPGSRRGSGGGPAIGPVDRGRAFCPARRDRHRLGHRP